VEEGWGDLQGLVGKRSGGGDGRITPGPWLGRGDPGS
jgi:hypothetical protein